ncbi:MULTISPECIES: NUDIX hydrolase [Micrococcaceae]|uniref:NUDIX hydrolase n=1 Tax=Micrococcaceae TaxID=1268 RepID=UPI001036363E|nr:MULTISPECIES: NUDIX hydrolase [Micrococcaceae]TAP27794.1 NUDIX hydrolase [Arthrobacter sp. S41]UXN33406.1 NUDIX hydrolase [Glutamicibacter sp. M10]
MTRRSEHTGESFDTRLAAYCLVENEGKILLTLWDMRHRDPKFTPRWSLPGGGIDLGEPIIEGAKREVYEETGYAVGELELLDVTTGVIPGAKRYSGEGYPMQTVAVVYKAKLTGGELRHEVNGSTSQAAWFTREEIQKLNCIERVESILRLTATGK